MIKSIVFSFLLLLLISCYQASAQMVTGNWHGKINGQRAEVKIVKSGDSISGTSYYYSSQNSYRRYSIKGYFDEQTNQVVWWDDQLVEEKAGGLLKAPGKTPLLSRADFNCPGGAEMYLDGSSNEKNEEIKEGAVHLEKVYSRPVFRDEWDWVIDNFTIGANDPYLIDSVRLIAFQPKPVPQPVQMRPAPPEKGMVVIPPARKDPEPVVKTTLPPQPEIVARVPQKTIEEKFTTRKKKIFSTIPLTGDSLTLLFYDNAIVDGDSISLFLNGQMIFSHIRLSAKPYQVTLAVKDLSSENELVMVAENLGDIPPNTSYMVATMGEKRFTANLSSTEESSAVIMLRKPGEK